jgi:hypothetical protein
VWLLPAYHAKQPEWSAMSQSFKDRHVTDAERLWLEAVYREDHFDVKTTKVKLRERLPRGFDPKKIDTRFLLNGKILTALGIWIIDPQSPILDAIERIIVAVRTMILADPNIETITAQQLSVQLKLPETTVRTALERLSDFGGFYSSAGGRADLPGYSSIHLNGDNAYDAYLAFDNIESLLQQYYERHVETPQYDVDSVSLDALAATLSNQARQPTDYHYLPQTPMLQHPIRKGTAFVLMPIDPDKAQLEDVYETIKQVCSLFDIRAYRADEIQHQDRITDRILLEIATCELLIADLSYERPNVYYEIGYAHALQKRPILYRLHGTRLHFDLSVHNVPEYKNITELRNLLTKRLEAVLGRNAPAASL